MKKPKEKRFTGYIGNDWQDYTGWVHMDSIGELQFPTVNKRKSEDYLSKVEIIIREIE